MELAGLAAKGAGAPDSLRRELSQLSGLPIPAQGQSPTAAQGVPAAQGAGVVPQYQQGNWYYASVDGNTTGWIEPNADPANEAPPDSNPLPSKSQFYPNMCGPGSAAKLLSHWVPDSVYSYNGTHYRSGVTSQTQGYMLQLALENHMMDYADPNFMGYWNTAPGKEAQVINQDRGFNFYVENTGQSSSITNGDYWGDVPGGLSLSNFNAHLRSDLDYSGLPMVLQVRAGNLNDGWNSSSNTEHLVQINGDDPTDGMVRYFDSANPAEDNAGVNNINPGFHNVPKSQLTLNGGLYDDIW